MRLKPTLRSGLLVLRTSRLEIGYSNNPLFTTDPIQLERQECAALM